MQYPRRNALGLLLIGVPATALASRASTRQGLGASRPNSKWAGVQVGLNVPYSFGTRTAMSAEQVLERTVSLGISAVELRVQPVEISLGLPGPLILGPAPSDYRAVYYPRGDAPEIIPPAADRTVLTPSDVADYKRGAVQRRAWRLALPMRAVEALRRKYDDAGVRIDVVKFDGLNDLEGEELDYAFNLAKALGARAISGEMSVPAVPRLGAAATRHRFMVALHNHLPITPRMWEDAFEHSQFLGANVDIGHFVAGNQTSPVPFIEKHHSRIPHIHIKDKTLNNVTANLGEGDTPVKEVLRLIRDRKWPIQATIEYDVKLPATADRTAEVAKAIDYCRHSLMTNT